MICLLAAVPDETTLIRQSLENCAQQSVNGLTVSVGKLFGHDIALAHSGIGKAAAAATCITLLISCRPQALWLFGCGGAYPGTGLKIGDLALADCEIFGDEGVDTDQGFHDLASMGLVMRQASRPFYNTWPVDRQLYDWAQPHLSGQAAKSSITLCSGHFVTVSSCTGTATKAKEIVRRTRGICENMEGAAVALACQQLSIPLLEMRGISNLVEDRDTARWDLAAGMTAAQNAVMALLESWVGP